MGRYVIYGAGAVGGVIGGRLALSGANVVLVARGAHLEALRRDGLQLTTPEGSYQPPVEVAGSIAEAAPRPEDVVILTVKSHSTAQCIAELAACADPATPVVCAQNCVENERSVLRHFANTYAVDVLVPSSHFSPGRVQQHSAPVAGVLDLGRYPRGVDGLARRIAADLVAAGFASRVEDVIMRFKYAKLLQQLGSSLDAVLAPTQHNIRSAGDEILDGAMREAKACLHAAGIEYESEDHLKERIGLLKVQRVVAGVARDGRSNWQALARHAGSVETDWMNGEIVLLGRLHGIPTPINEALGRVTNEVARRRGEPRSLTVADIEAAIQASCAGAQPGPLDMPPLLA